MEKNVLMVFDLLIIDDVEFFDIVVEFFIGDWFERIWLIIDFRWDDSEGEVRILYFCCWVKEYKNGEVNGSLEVKGEEYFIFKVKV